MSNAAEEAAAALVPQMVNDLVQAMPLASEDVLAADLEAARSAAAAPELVPSSQPQTAPAAAQAPAAPEPVVEEEFNLDPVISDDLQALLDEPDFEEEAELEVADAADEWDPDATDPETAKRLKTLEKRNQWLEDQRVRTESKKWVAENLKAYPLLNRYAPDEVKTISATSRRSFAREAAKLNDKLATMLKPALEEIDLIKKTVAPQVQQEVRAEYKQAWGDITTGPGVAPVATSAEAEEYNAAMKTGNLQKVMHVLLKGAGISN